MDKAARVVAFVGVSSLDAAERFYGAALGLELADQRPFALVADVAGTMLRITEVPEVAPVSYTVLGWSVSDIAASMAELTSRGIAFNRYDFMEQDERGVWTAPDGSRIAWFLDPDGNNLSLTQFAT